MGKLRNAALSVAGAATLVAPAALTAEPVAADHLGSYHCWQELHMDSRSTGRDYMDFEAVAGGPNSRVLQGTGQAFADYPCSRPTRYFQKRVYVPSGYDIRVLCDTGYYVIKTATGWNYLTTCSDGENDYAKLYQRGNGYFS